MAIAYEISREGKKKKNETYSDTRLHEITIYSGKRKKDGEQDVRREQEYFWRN